MPIAPLLSRGDRLGPYEILAEIGSGGMGRVYRAIDSRLNRVVAIKTSAEEFTDRFEREAHAIAKLNHPNICRLYDVGPNYLVMELVEGRPLEGPLPVARVIELACEILDSISEAHRRGIIHRDLKPSNILITPRGSKLLDFGLAKPTTPPGDTSEEGATRPLTATGQIVGTVSYMAPEQLQGKASDARADLFSFGCVLYEMLTGARAFDGDDPASVIAAILTREAPSVVAIAPALDRVVRRALAKDPDHRFQTAADLKAALLWAMEQPPPSPVSRRRRQWMAVAAAGAVAVAAAAGWTAARLQVRDLSTDLYRFEVAAPQEGHFVFGVNAGGVALSPDGMTIAFVLAVDGRNGLWVRQFDETEARLLPGTEAAGFLHWAPDGKSIGFAAGNTLWRVDLSGGQPIPICPANMVRGAAWTPGGEIIFGMLSSGLSRVAATGGAPMPLTTLDEQQTEGFHGFPVMLDHDRFLYFVRAAAREQTGLYVSSLARPAERTFLFQTEANALLGGDRDGSRYLLWTRGGTLLAQRFDPQSLRLTGPVRPIADTIGISGINGYINAAASMSGSLVYSQSSGIDSQFTWMNRSGTTTGTIGEPGSYSSFDLSPDGRRIVASRERPGGSDLWLIDAGRGGIATRLTARPDASLYPVWSPDSTRVVFGSDALYNLYSKNMAGAREERRLTQSAHMQLPLDWSADGESVLFYEAAPSTGRDLMTIPASADGPSTPYLRSPFNEWWASFAPLKPPRWIAYQSDESGHWEIYLDTYPIPTDRRRISTGGGQFPRWGPGGGEIFYVSPDLTLMSAELTMTNRGLNPLPRRPLFKLPIVDTGRRPYAVAPDGERFLVRAMPPRAGTPLMVMVGWPSLLESAPNR